MNSLSLPRLLFPPNDNTKHHRVHVLLLTLSPLPLALSLSPNGTDVSSPPPIKQFPIMAIIIVVLLTSCFFTALVSVYVQRCANRLPSPSVVPLAFGRRPLRNAGRGLDPSILESFPTYLYSSVRGHKINKAVSLECAVCLNEFVDEETLQLIPKCCHAFHPECIGSWLSSHTTCPVCRADLAPEAGEVISHIHMIGNRCAEGREATEAESFRVSSPDQEAGVETTTNSRFTGNGISQESVFNYLPRALSMVHSVMRPGEECERFTLRLPEGVMRNHEMIRRTKSLVTFPRERSHRSGYKTVSNRWTVGAFSGRFGSDRSSRGDEWDVV